MAKKDTSGTGTGDNFIAVAAIDFGTTYSGFAVSLKAKPKKVFMKTNWGGPIPSNKTNTALCVEEQANGKPVLKSFGYLAYEDYAAYLTEATGPPLHLFDLFKMKLFDQKNLSLAMELTSTDGKYKAHAIDIFALALNRMREEVTDRLQKSMKSKLTNRDIKWVLTVPAIWNDAAKEFMRRAAHQAKLIDDVYSDQLLIALEPEAASLYCCSADVECVFDDEDVEEMPAGTKYLIVDAGGGTVDMAAHKVIGPDELQELAPPSGGPWGGSQVDKLFEDLMASILGKEFILRMKNGANLNSWISFMQSFEKCKRTATGVMRLQLPHQLSQAYSGFYGKPIDTAFAKDKIKHEVTLSSGVISLKEPAVKKLFDPVVTHIVLHLREVLRHENLEGLSYIMLVGGFGECQYLSNAIETEFKSDSLHVLVPEGRSLAIMRGAVMFGYSPKTITSRVCPKSYGIAVTEDYVVGQHDPARMVRDHSGKKLVKNVFSMFVKKNTAVSPHKPSKKTLYPSVNKEYQGILHIYASDRDRVRYTTEEGVDPVGSVQVDVPRFLGADTPITVSMVFGGTEIKVRAQGGNGPEAVDTSANISFLPGVPNAKRSR